MTNINNIYFSKFALNMMDWQTNIDHHMMFYPYYLLYNILYQKKEETPKDPRKQMHKTYIIIYHVYMTYQSMQAETNYSGKQRND